MEEGGTNVESLVPPSLNSEDGSEREEEEVEKAKEDDVGKEEKDSGGIINNFIAFITPLSPKPSHNDESVAPAAAADDDGEKGGVIRKMVSSFFHHSEGEEGVVVREEEKDEEETMADEKVKRFKTENGGIIHNIASRLPAPVPDDAVPTADEATFLINSLVRD
ncbi:hypothetical protein LR48_Vigan03g083100 [Vigna angularis]|uniref:Uncharacterized protein n=2 Tax=Phaseolus angularis TaxID=3914 RepID=A0A0L9U4Z6_PHAAN|nr:uncharacterized protein LOC108328750 [Vigna angularis]KOM37449.1 hypothetical protein LR48_Vigan03g083100 [Vigna angularis]BAT84044.1 hypothetical protein VIGAN_04130900 [Vigna angularis var. angularis]